MHTCSSFDVSRLHHWTTDPLRSTCRSTGCSPVVIIVQSAEWQAEAKERELEAIALRHIKAEAKAAERASRAEVDVDAVRQEQRSGEGCDWPRFYSQLISPARRLCQDGK